MISKLTLIAAVVAANEFEEEAELHNNFVDKKWIRDYNWGDGWCSHAGAYTLYADLNGDGTADQTCHDNKGNHWHRLADKKGNLGAGIYSPQIKGWCTGKVKTRFADLNGDKKVEMLCDDNSGNHWAMLGNGGNWKKSETKKHSQGWCSHAGSYLSYADFNGDGKADMFCDDNIGRHWVALSRGDGTFQYKTFSGQTGWCTKAYGQRTQHADINGDGKADMICDGKTGGHWSKLSTGTSYGEQLLLGEEFCKGGITRYAIFEYDTKHPKAADMMCDKGDKHFMRRSLGNGKFETRTWKLNTGAWCNAKHTQYADINGNGVDDLICDENGQHNVLIH